MKAKQINSLQEFQNYVSWASDKVFDSFQSMDDPSLGAGTETSMNLIETLNACITVNNKFSNDSRTEKFRDVWKNKKALIEQWNDYVEIRDIILACQKRWIWVKIPSRNFRCNVVEMVERNIVYWSTKKETEKEEVTDNDTSIH